MKQIFLYIFFLISFSLSAQRQLPSYNTAAGTLTQMGAGSGYVDVKINYSDQTGMTTGAGIDSTCVLIFFNTDDSRGYELPVLSVTTPSSSIPVVRVDITGFPALNGAINGQGVIYKKTSTKHFTPFVSNASNSLQQVIQEATARDLESALTSAIDITKYVGSGAPAFTPATNEPKLAQGLASPYPFYAYNGLTWVLVGSGGSLTPNSVDSTHIKSQSIAASDLSQHAIDSIRNITGVTSTTNLVSNGDFSSGLTGWRQDAGKWVAVSGGVNKATNVTYRDTLIQDITMQLDTLYRLEYTVNNYISGGVNFNVGGAYGNRVNANGSYIEYFTCTKAASGVIIQDEENTNLIVDNIRLFKVTKAQLNYQADIKAENITTNGAIYTNTNKGVFIGNWENGLTFGVGSWNWAPTQPPVSIGQNAMRNGTGVAVGAYALAAQGDLGYSTAMGIGAGKRNISGHITVFGTGAGQNLLGGNSVVVGDEALASETGGNSNAHGYYALNHSTSGYSTGMGDLIFTNATTGINTGVGYRSGLLNTTGQMTTLGFEVGYQNTTGKMIGVGQEAGGGSNTTIGANTTDQNMIYIGDNTRKSVNTVMTNSVVVGHAGQIEKSNQTVLGNDQMLETRMWGNVGIGKSPTTALDILKNTNSLQSISLQNANTGTASEVGFTLIAGDNTAQLITSQTGNAVWGKGSRLFTGGGFVFGSTTNTDFYTASTLRTRVTTAGKLEHYGVSSFTGNMGVGANFTPSEQLHIKGDYIRLAHTSANGSTAAPRYYGMKFFSNNDAYEHARIEVSNRLSNLLEGQFKFSLTDAAGTLVEALTIDGANKQVRAHKLVVSELVQGTTADSVVVSALGGELKRLSITEVVNTNLVNAVPQGELTSPTAATTTTSYTVTVSPNIPTGTDFSHIELYFNGIRQRRGAGKNYTITSSTTTSVTFDFFATVIEPVTTSDIFFVEIK